MVFVAIIDGSTGSLIQEMQDTHRHLIGCAKGVTALPAALQIRGSNGSKSKGRIVICEYEVRKSNIKVGKA